MTSTFISRMIRRSSAFSSLFKPVWLAGAATFLLAMLSVLPVRADGMEQSGLDQAIDAVLDFAARDGATEFDPQTAAPLVEFILSTAGDTDFVPSSRERAPGAYDAYDVRMGMADLLRYLYNHEVPAPMMKPASIRSSEWMHVQGGGTILPPLWEKVDALDVPVVVRGRQRDANTPDLTTNAYHVYDLDRTLVLYRHEGRTVLLSISKQIGDSAVGKKGAVIGPDASWNYLYTDDEGLGIRGLGWVDSYIYNYLSICAYITADAPDSVRYGVFQWLRAGWSGINMVKTSHIEKGLARFERDFKAIIESSQLPPPQELSNISSRISAMPREELVKHYRKVVAGLLSTMEQSPRKYAKDLIRDLKSGAYIEAMSREDLANALYVEAIKGVLGRPTPMDQALFTAQGR